MTQQQAEDIVYCTVYGNAMARQVFDHMASGRGAPDEDDFDRFAEEAACIATMAAARLPLPTDDDSAPDRARRTA